MYEKIYKYLEVNANGERKITLINIRVQVGYKLTSTRNGNRECIVVFKFCYIFHDIHVYDSMVYKKGTLICTVLPAELARFNRISMKLILWGNPAFFV